MTNFRNVLLLTCASPVLGTQVREGAGMRLSVNPIRRVVTLLQTMQKKIDSEGERELKLHDKYMCYCKTGGENLQAGISEAGAKIPQLMSSLEEATAEKSQLESDLTSHKNDKSATNTAIDEAKQVRKKEAADFKTLSEEAKTNIAALAKAIVALEKGLAGGFLQTTAGTQLVKFTNSDDFQAMDMTDSDRDEITSFVQNGEPGPGGSMEIDGILKQMKETMEKALADAESKEAESIKVFDSLVDAKTKEADALTAMVESKTERLGEVGVDMVNLAQDLDDTRTALAEDTKFVGDLKVNCDLAVKEWDVRLKMRSEEIVAVTETIKILNDDDALDLFKKTLPSTSLLQTMVTSKEMIKEAQEVLRSARKHSSKHGRVHIDLIALSLHGKKVNFGKVLKMVDDMVAELGVEQKADDAKKKQCAVDLDAADDDKKVLNREISDLSKLISDQTAQTETLSEEIAALEASIKNLDAEVADRTHQRKINHDEYVDELASNQAAVQLLEIAKNRMNKFYNPKLYKAPPKRELSEEERISLNMGGTLAPTAAPGGIAGTGVTALDQEEDDDDDEASFLQVSSKAKRDAPPAPPAAMGAYKKSSSEGTGAVAMIDMLKKDLELEIEEMQVEEKGYQKAYEEFVGDAADQRVESSKYLTEKANQKADLEVNIERNNREHGARKVEAMNNDKLIMDLHADCDWLLQNFDVRKEARAGEADALKKAKAVLSGADYSLVQTSSHRRLRRQH